ncbi:outer membrane protein assembly factor BamA [Ahrensia marina]|uniref:Outer membrane protein assembly factor BamA n=1 Tax=Ahrensia marina TaxID=1514904 RepID=A0A0N0E7N8_9HYPH|nr:outer membrane protein assembly factor BamA [Ahrensia marina]KPB01411.1 outer membrane protein assembly protein YaeT [Ahrensia marina]
MRAARKLLNAASIFALSVTPAVGGAVILQAVSVSTADAAVVRSISVSGNQRVADATIADFVGYQSGKNFTSAEVDNAVKALFRTGLFSDVSVNTSGSTLVINVVEYATVNQVLFQGNRKLKDDRLEAVVRLRSRERFDQQALDADVDAIVEAYSRTGRSDVQVNASVVDLGENRVNVIFQIAEGGKTKISQINFVGNNAFGDRRLQGIISIKKTNLLSWFTRTDVYDDQRLAADEEQLRRFYFNRGYADFRVISSSANVDPETGNIAITFEVDEGERYAFGNIDIDSTVSGVDPEELKRSVETRDGKTYSAKDVEDTLIAMSEKLAAKGFPFAEVTPVGNRNFENNTIDVSYIVDQGQRAYVERIEIVGNTTTRDYVIRREFDLSEGDAFNQILIRRAQKRLEALDFFQRVEITTRPGSQPDRVIIVVQVADKPTGEFGVGVGYSTGSTDTSDKGVNFEGSISQRNFQGRGQAIRLAVGGGVDSRTYNVSFTEPYFLGYRMSATFRAFRSTNSYDDDGYDSATSGGSVSFGLPITDNFSANFGYSYSQDEYTVTDAALLPSAIDTEINSGRNPYIRSAINYGFVYNSIDDRNDPHEGVYVSVQQQVAGLGGDAKYIKTTADGRYYHTLSEEADIVGFLRAGGGNITGLGEDVRVFDNLRLGPSRIRGFETNGIGPVDAAGNHLGGTSYLNFTAEAQFPLPAVPRDLGFKGAIFADAATLFGSDLADATAASTDMKFRTSAGISLIWQSPFAPLRIDYAFPISKEDTDEVQQFNFSVSSAF